MNCWSRWPAFHRGSLTPNGLKVVETDGQGRDDGQPLRPATGQEIKAEQKKAKRRRKQKEYRHLESRGLTPSIGMNKARGFFAELITVAGKNRDKVRRVRRKVYFTRFADR